MDQIEARLRALRKQENGIEASIGAIRDGALREMEQTSKQARHEEAVPSIAPATELEPLGSSGQRQTHRSPQKHGTRD